MSAPLKLLSSMATRELLAELAAAYSRDQAQAVHTEATGGVDAAKRVQAGEAVDMVVLASNAIDKLIADGKLQPGRVDLVKSGVAIAVRKGAARHDVNNEAAVKRAVLAAQSVSYSTGPSGTYLQGLFERWGIYEQIKNKIVIPPPGVPVGSLVAKGEVELGFQQLSELMNLAGIDVLGPLPPAIQTLTIFSGGVSMTSAQPEAARRVLDYMASPATGDVKRRHGMEAA